MITIALTHGKKHHNRGAIRYTLTDRILRHSPYQKFTHTLRGLTVVAHAHHSQIYVATAYWN
jgi:hypothetical protein